MPLSEAMFLRKVVLQLGMKQVFRNRKWSLEFHLTAEAPISLTYQPSLDLLILAQFSHGRRIGECLLRDKACGRFRSIGWNRGLEMAQSRLTGGHCRQCHCRCRSLCRWRRMATKIRLRY